jgi:Bacterial Ig domain
VISVSQPTGTAAVRGTVTVSGTATARAGIAQVLVSVDGGTPVPATGATTWSAAVDTTALPNGAHTLTVQATDVNGTSGRTSVPITVDNTSPATSCPAPPAGSTELSGNLSLETAQSGWTGVYNSNTALARVQPPGGGYDGGWALRVSPKAGGAAGVNNANPLWVPGSPGLATAAGRTYTGSALVRADAGRKITMLVRETTSAGTAVGSRSVTLTLPDTGWQRISGAYTAKASGNVLKYSLYGSNFASSTQNFLADCLSLQSR